MEAPQAKGEAPFFKGGCHASDRGILMGPAG
jgi:hypothetical protein